MKLFANRRIKFLFAGILWSILAFTLISALLAGFEVRNASYCILFSSLCMGAVISVSGISESSIQSWKTPYHR